MSAEGVPTFQVLRDLKFIKLPESKKKVVDHARIAFQTGTLTDQQLKKVRAIYNAHHAAILDLKNSEDLARVSMAKEKMLQDGLGQSDIEQKRQERLSAFKKQVTDFGL
jgi:hypothetical protein